MDGAQNASNSQVQNATERPFCNRRYGLLTLPVSEGLLPHAVDKLTAAGLTQEEARTVLAETGEYAPAFRRYLNSAGIEVEPILFHDEDDTIVAQMDAYDGIFLTGGDTLFDLEKFTRDGLDYFRVVMNPAKPYLLKVRRILEKVKQINGGGRHYPLFAICLGYEAILLSETDFHFPIAHVVQNNVNIPISFTGDEGRYSHIFNEEDKNDISTRDLVFFFHNLGFLARDFYEYPTLVDNYIVAAVNETDNHGTEIAVIEHRELPIYALQFHPEKVLFDTSLAYTINKCERGTKLNEKFVEVLKGEEYRGLKQVESHEQMLAQVNMFSVTMPNLGGIEHMTFVSRNPLLKLLGGVSPSCTSL